MVIKFIRKIDDLGRIVIPKDLREIFELNPGDDIEISADDIHILISKAENKNK